MTTTDLAFFPTSPKIIVPPPPTLLMLTEAQQTMANKLAENMQDKQKSTINILRQGRTSDPRFQPKTAQIHFFLPPPPVTYHQNPPPISLYNSISGYLVFQREHTACYFITPYTGEPYSLIDPPLYFTQPPPPLGATPCRPLIPNTHY